MSPIRVQIKQTGTLLSVLLDREVTEEQARLVGKLIEVTGLAEPADVEKLEQTLDFAIEELSADAPAGAGDSVEAYRG